MIVRMAIIVTVIMMEAVESPLILPLMNMKVQEMLQRKKMLTIRTPTNGHMNTK
jgi:hypothetical protein